ncbi:MAG: Holliday junction branch migration protein RuvA [Coriobacteriales bacterium]|nr:Holliday junction branch migration protein RuvA [Actinomycetes bacterium]
MIAHLTGRVASKEPGSCVIDVGGIGFRVAMSGNSLASLPAQGDEVTVLTHMQVRDDEISLFGFENRAERELFTHLLGVTGVGPKVALAVLSAFRPDALVEAIAHEDVALVSTVPGIGKKTAQRIILELKDRLSLPDISCGPANAPMDVAAEACDALLSMGFSSAEVGVALQGYDGPADDVQSVLRHALRRLGGGV